MTMSAESNPSSEQAPAGRRERKAPDARRQALIEATIRSLASHGVERTSVRRICERAGVSVGLVNHYYASKEDLVADAYVQVADDLLAALRDEVARRGGSARERLSTFFRASFSPVVLDPDLLRAWLSFWDMIYRSERIAAVHARTYADYRDELERMLTALAREQELPDLDVRLTAIGLSGLLDGLWLEWCLSAGTFEPQEGVRLCEACLDGMTAAVRRDAAAR